MSEQFAETNGIKLCYEIKGEGEPLLLVHGFGVNRLVWIAQFGPLSEHFKVIRFDNRSAGKSDHPKVEPTMETYADDINGLLDFLKLDKVNILGWSLGGMIVQNFVLKYPQRVNKLILINTLPEWPGDEKGIEMYVNGQIEAYHSKLKDPLNSFFETAKQGYSRNFFKQMKEDPNKTFYGLFSAQDIAKNRATDMSTPEDILNMGKALASHKTLDRLKDIKNDTLIICAEKDKLTPKMMNEKIHAGIPNSKLIVLAGVGHDSPLEKAPEINKAIIDFLKS